MRSSNSRLPPCQPSPAQLLDPTSPVAAEIVLNLGSPSLERDSAAPRYYPNIETLFSWPVFQNQNMDNRLNLKTLLQSNGLAVGTASIPLDFEHDDAGRLLDIFFEFVHIYNPVIETTKVRQYLRDAQLNGVGWKAQSCLLVQFLYSCFLRWLN